MARKSSGVQGSETKTSLQEMDFDQWRELFETDPAKFEQLREQALNDLIDSAPVHMKPRLEGLKFQLKGESIRAKSSLDYQIRLSNMMMDSLLSLRDQVQSLLADINEPAAKPSEPKTAVVLPFARPDKLDD